MGLFLPPPHQDVDDLPDLVVAAHDRIYLAELRLLGQVDGEFLQGFLPAHLREGANASLASPGSPEVSAEVISAPARGQPG